MKLAGRINTKSEEREMKRLVVALICLTLCPGVFVAQKGKAEPGYYPMGYSGDTWTGEVTAFDDEQRTLTLTNGTGKNAETFVASIPDSPYEWTHDIRKNRVLDFPFDKKATSQTFKYDGPGFAATLLPDSAMGGGNTGMFRRPNPPDSNRIDGFADFMSRRVTVYYTSREREVSGKKVKYNDVWRIQILPAKKK
jgi:hypothetical protein